jgi:hypothetical protein
MVAGSKIGVLIFLALAPLSSRAAELYGPEVGVVPFGMGRAYSAVDDDWLALHYNPAGLALVNKVDLQLFDLRVASNRDVIENYNNISNMNSDSSNVATILDSYAGKHVMAEISNHSQITVPHFAIGLGYQISAAIDMQNTSYPQTIMRYTKDTVVSLGGAVSSGGKRKSFRIGARFDLVSRRGGIDRVGIDEILGNRDALIDRFDRKGTGIGGTIGMQYRLPTNGRTEINTSFVWHNVGKTSFGNHMSANRPTRIDDNMVAGLAVRLPIGGRKNRRYERRYGPTRSMNHLTFAFDYSHLNRSMDEEHFPKHVHLGMNLDLPILSLQVGLNQTSLTMGASFDIGVIRVAAASYAEELGSFGGQRRDRRYLLSVGSGFGFKGF